MIVDVAIAALLQLVGLWLFRRFERRTPLWRRVLKFLIVLAASGVLSYFSGRTGFVIAVGAALLPVIFVHAIWLPKHGVNGIAAEPREKYYALRGWRT